MTFKWHKWIGLLALLSVVVHAGLVVRHNAIMVAATFAHHDLVGALGVICHSSKDAPDTSDEGLPGSTPPSSNTVECPVCMGFGGTSAILAERVTPKQVYVASAVRLEIVAEILLRRISFERPPTRGPPHFA